MQHYNKEIRRILITVVVIAALIASVILIAAIFSEPPQITDDDLPEDGHYANLPTAPLTVIIDSGTQGTQLVGNLEFGFVNHSTGYAIGLYEDWLQIHNGLNRTDAIGLGYEEVRYYAFAYQGDTILFDSWTNRSSSASGSGSDGVEWSPQQKGGLHTGDIREDEIDSLTMAGFVIEYETLRVYFKDGSNYQCGPANLTLGVNFTLVDGEWSIEYIFEASSSSDISFGTNSVTIQLTQEIPIADDDTINTEVPVYEERIVLLPVMAIPVVIGMVILGLIVLSTRRQ